MGISLLSPVTAHNCAFTVLDGGECSMNITVSGAYDLSYSLNCNPLNDSLTVTFGLTKNGVIDDEFHRLTKSSVLRMFNRPCVHYFSTITNLVAGDIIRFRVELNLNNKNLNIISWGMNCKRLRKNN